MNQPRFFSWLASWVVRALAFTVRMQTNDRAGYFDPARRQPCIVAAWHNRILLLPVCFARFRNGQNLVVLTSASRDGEILTAIVRRFGIGAVRGSSSRRGALALRELTEVLAGGSDVIITPDGPRGPCYVLGPGLVYLAQKTGLPLMRVSVDYARYWELKSWDRFRVPKPFSKVEITLHPFEALSFSGPEADIEAERLRFEARLRDGQV
jgi:lysophospholipid acyltransferase (LPLAT)-like uncharacterized protein